MGRRRVAPSRPLPEASGGGGGDRPSASFGQDAVCRRRRRAEGKVRTCRHAGFDRARAGRKGPAIGAGSCRRALAERGQEEEASGELWPGGGREEGAVGRCSVRQRAEAPRGMREMKASQEVKRGDLNFF